MEYDIIFYQSKRTGLSQKVITKKLDNYNFELKNIDFSFEANDFVKRLGNSLKKRYLIILVGALNTNKETSMESILSYLISDSENTVLPQKVAAKTRENDGYIIKCNNQQILVLPDSPDDIEYILSSDFCFDLENKF